MFCPNCGADLQGRKFCIKCGARADGAETARSVNSASAAREGSSMQSRKQKTAKKGGGGVIVLLLVAVIGVTAFWKPGFLVHRDSGKESAKKERPGIVQSITGLFKKEPEKLGVIEGDIISKEELVPLAAAAAGPYRRQSWRDYRSEAVYDGMTAAQKTFYQRLEDMADTYMDDSSLDAKYDSEAGRYLTRGVKYSDLDLSKDDLSALEDWFLFNSPQYWFLDHKQYYFHNGAMELTVSEMGADGARRSEITEQIFEKVDAWVGEAQNRRTTYLKAWTLHKKLLDAVQYVHGEHDQYIYSTFIQGETVCAGYAEGMNVLLNAAGIDSVCMLSDNHAWNYVRMDDGSWYAVDTTWCEGSGQDIRYFLISQDALQSGGAFGLKEGQFSEKAMAALAGMAFNNDTDENGVALGMENHDPLEKLAAFFPDLPDASYEPTEDEQHDLPAPTGLTLTRTGKDEARVTWDPVEGAQAYEVSVYGIGHKYRENHELVTGTRVTVSHFDKYGNFIDVKAVTGDGESAAASVKYEPES